MMENVNQITVELKIFIYLGNKSSQSLMKLHFNANISRRKPLRITKIPFPPHLKVNFSNNIKH